VATIRPLPYRLPDAAAAHELLADARAALDRP
jgi:hypothetical protein